MLIPVIGLVQVGQQSMADRYTYLPLIGLFIMAVWGGREALLRLRAPPWVAAIGAGLILLCCAGATREQLRFWQTTDALYGHALTVAPNNPVIRQDLGNHYYNLANASRKEGRLAQAVSEYHQALELTPNDPMAHNNLGLAFQKQGLLQQAIEEHCRAIELCPTNVNARNNLSVALTRVGRLDEAIQQLNQAVRYSPDDPEPHNNLAALLFRKGDYEQAIHHYQLASVYAPNNPAIYDNLAAALARVGRMDAAIANYRKALQINPRDAIALKHLQALRTP
jgi:Flp pilus assembly protein TadD